MLEAASEVCRCGNEACQPRLIESYVQVDYAGDTSVVYDLDSSFANSFRASSRASRSGSPGGHYRMIHTRSVGPRRQLHQ
jgi:hypothetical protein